METKNFHGVGERPSGPEPSGRLQVLESKDFPYLHTGKSLVFVIASNGHVWGKRLDRESGYHDIELEIFWPREDGCLVRRVAPRGDLRLPPILVEPSKELSLYLQHPNSMTVSQREKIQLILSQKDTIQYELGTLMVRPFVNLNPDWRSVPQYHRKTDKCTLDFMHGEPCDIKVVDCSYAVKASYGAAIYQWWTSVNLSAWRFRYDDVTADFKFFADRVWRGKESFAMGTPEVPVRFADVQNIESVFDNGTAMIGRRFFAARLAGKKFDMADIKLRSNTKVNPCLHIMYGEHDFFEYFEVDDAALILEEETCSADFPKLSWTLAIAQNKHIREMMRLASNNPDLFAKLLPQARRRVGGGTTDTL